MLKKIKYVGVIGLLAVSTTFGQGPDANQPGRPPQDMPPPPGARVNAEGEVRMPGAGLVQRLKAQFQGRPMGTTTDPEGRPLPPGVASNTPWKEFKQEVKDIRQEYRQDVKAIMKDNLMLRFENLTEAQISALAMKLGITAEAFKSQMTNPVALWAIIQAKITKEDLMQIVPPATGTMATRTMEMKKEWQEKREDLKEARTSFFQQLRVMFGRPASSTNIQTTTTVDANGNVITTQNSGATSMPPRPSLQEILRAWFSF